MHKEKPEDAGREEEFAVESIISTEQEQALLEIWRSISPGKSQSSPAPEHLAEAVLYDLVLGKCSPEQEEAARGHIATCEECRYQFADLQKAVAQDQEMRALWAPKVLRAAGGERSTSPIKDVTSDDERKYVITLQPTRDPQKDLLIFEVTPAFRQRFEGKEFTIVVNATGTVVLRGTVAGGKITRLIDRELCDQWPFRVHAG